MNCAETAPVPTFFVSQNTTGIKGGLPTVERQDGLKFQFGFEAFAASIFQNIWRVSYLVLGIIFLSGLTTFPAVAQNDQDSQSAATNRQIALTFDDAPRANGMLLRGVERTSMLIDALESVDVDEALFFVTTGNISSSPEGAGRLRRYTAAGHRLANHSHAHAWLNRTDSDAYLADIDQASSILTRFSNVDPFFRFPYLDEGKTAAKRKAVADGLRQRGLQNGYVTVDNYEWYMQALVDEALSNGHTSDIDVLRQTYVSVLMETIEFYDAIAVDVLGRSPKHVLLLHENDLAAMFVDDLVLALRREGWQIISAREAYTDPISKTVPLTAMNGQGRVAAIAHSSGVDPRYLVHKSEDEFYLRALFEQRGLIAAE